MPPTGWQAGPNKDFVMSSVITRTPQTAAAMRQLALSLFAFLVAATLPYVWLIENFGYDDILREPAAVVLQRFHEGGSPLVLAWLAFAMSALLFIVVVNGFSRLFDAHWVCDRGTTILGIGSALAQSIGLLRWVLVIPGLAATYVDPATSPAARDATLVVFDAVHRYGGMVLGEMIGQLLLAAWTGLVAIRLMRSRLVPRWLAAVGLLTLPLWLLGQTELIHGVVPGVPAIEVIPLAFMGWEAWLAALAVTMGIQGWRDRAGLSAKGPAMPA
jgi:Domain of unknown function (DUF4386)